MKYLLYFHFYTISCGDSLCHYPITSVMLVTKDSLTFYVYDLGYTWWHIDKREREEILNDYHLYKGRKYKKHIKNAIYRISYQDIKGFVTVNYLKTEIRIIVDGRTPEIIQLRE